MKLIKPEELKAFMLGLGLSALFLACSFLTTTARRATDNQNHGRPKNTDVKEKVEHYSEILGMN